MTDTSLLWPLSAFDREDRGSTSLVFQSQGLERYLRGPLESRVKEDLPIHPPAIRGNWSRIALSGLSSSTYSRLITLAALKPGWLGQRSSAMSTNSLRDFLEFWENIKALVPTDPTLTLTADGRVQASWHQSWKRHLELEFVGNGKAFIGMFDGGSVHEGVDAISVLVTLLKARNGKPLRWQNR